ncbi:MAG: response regulator transcription factor [Hyphomicrobiaceae bacterium]
MFETVLQDLGICTTEIQERSEGAAFLKVARSAYPLADVVYIALNIPIGQQRGRYMQCAYSDRWLKQCVSHEPVSTGQLGGLAAMFREPLDWAEMAQRPTSSVEATLSFPLRASHGEMASFCIAANESFENWPDKKKALAREFQTLGGYFHQHMLRIWGHDTERDMLISARELECLKWIAEGKTAWEAGVILGISERTVRFHLNAAREKLDCLTTTQAVAKAVAQQLIAL